MADGPNYRGYRANDPFARAPAAAEPQGGHGDPLAELARLIGQNDPFADFGRDPAAKASPGAYTPAPAANPTPPMPAAAPFPPTPPPFPAARDGGYRTPEPREPTAYESPSYATPAFEPSAGGLASRERHDDPIGASPGSYAARGYVDPQAEAPVPGYADERSRGYAPSYPSPDYPSPEYPQNYAGGYDEDSGLAPAGGREHDPYYQGLPGMAAPGELQYDEEPAPRRRGGLAIVLAVVGLAVIGTAAAFGYRTYFGGVRTAHQAPPVIRADTAPTKVVPAIKTSDAQNGKLIYDRVASPGEGERVVPREENPVDINAAAAPNGPRVIFPGPTPNAAPGAASVPPSAIGEPKKVHTVTIRPDQLGTNAAPPPPAPSRATAPAAVARIASVPSPAESEPPPPVRTVPTRRVTAPAAPAVPPEDAPLSLAPAAASRTTREATAATAVPTRSGGYAVQVSSQRSEAEAQASFRSLSARYPSVLGGQHPLVRRVDLGERGIYYRAMVGPFASIEEATSLCSSLKAAGGQCVVQRN